MTIGCLDAFAGIGGVSLALKGIATTKLYCEWNPFCQSVLTTKMSEGILHKAPIHADINTLYLPEDSGIEMITAGYPCQDISSIGLQKGIREGTRSGLFYQVTRLLYENPGIKAVFLENVSNILKVGLGEVLIALTELNFTFAWTIKSAGEFGAPHQRSRWFLLGIRDSFDVSKFDLSASTPDFVQDWSDEPARRFDYKASADPQWSQRCQALGNGVCPLAVRMAFLELAKVLGGINTYTQLFRDFAKDPMSLQSYNSTGLVHNGKYYDLPVFGDPTKTPDTLSLKITLRLPGNPTDPIVLKRYPTPRNGITHPSALTARSIRDLPTVLVQCEETRVQLNSDEKIIPSVRYIEWMMGYPADYTYVPPRPDATGSPPPDHEIDPDLEETGTGTSSHAQPRQVKYNGMHAFMKTITGKKDIPTVAKLWNGLSEERKAHFRNIAKTLM
ncbi:MAG: hypothetical protein EBU90_10285 [Proteobacteria bacterium]|nr:hypothetical protein [Pseudomonadota bacterium]NBP13797.1 hypothetical protein [bacterium]